MPKYVLGRVEFGGVGREKLQREASALSINKVSDHSTAVLRESIPYHQQRSIYVAKELAEEIYYLGTADCPFVKPEEKVPQGYPSRQRQGLAVHRVEQR